MLINSEGEILIDTKEIKHNLVNFEKVKEEITEINPENLTVFTAGRIFHISLIVDVSPYCDCHAENDAPVVPKNGMRHL